MMYSASRRVKQTMGINNNDGRITPESLEEYRSRVGNILRVSDVFNERASRIAIRRFCDGIGDSNPLYTDPEYAAASVWRREYAPPSFVVSVFPGWILQGLPGVHAFHTSSSFHFYICSNMFSHKCYIIKCCSTC